MRKKNRNRSIPAPIVMVVDRELNPNRQSLFFTRYTVYSVSIRVGVSTKLLKPTTTSTLISILLLPPLIKSNVVMINSAQPTKRENTSIDNGIIVNSTQAKI